MTAASPQWPRLDIGRVVQQAFMALGRNFATDLILGLILVGLPSVALAAMRMSLGPHKGVTVADVLTYASQVAVVALLQATVIHRAATEIRGHRASVMECLGLVLRLLAPLLAIQVIYSAAFFGGLFLLLVPGILALVSWNISIAAYVVERPGLIGSFRTSAELTRGHRWGVFGLFTIETVAQVLFGWVIFLIFATLPRAVGGEASPLLYDFVGTPLYYVALALFSAALRASLYLELRQMRDGVGVQGVASIFD